MNLISPVEARFLKQKKKQKYNIYILGVTSVPCVIRYFSCCHSHSSKNYIGIT